MVCFALLVLFLSWDSRNDGSFGSMWFSPDNRKMTLIRRVGLS